MTAALASPRADGCRVGRLLATEALVQARSGVATGTGLATLVWGVVLLVLPGPVRVGVVPWVLLLDVAALGFFTAPSLAVVERATGVTAGHAVAGASAAAALGRRLVVLVGWSTTSSTVLVVAAGVPRPAVVVVGAALATALFAVLSLATLGHDDTLVAWMPRVPLVAVPLVVPALLVATGISTGAAWDLSPVTAAWHWLTGSPSAPGLAWTVAWIVVLARWVARTGWVLPGSGYTATRPSRAFSGWTAGPKATTGSRWARAIGSLARVDRRTLGDDRLLAMLLAGVPLLAVVVRVGSDPALALAMARTGLDLRPDLPAAWALLLVVHTATMVGAVAGLLVLEDRDAGALVALAATPRGVATMLAWRLVAAAGATAVLVIVGLVVAGAHAGAGVVGLVATVLAAAVASGVPAVLMATLGRDRVAGVVVMKAIGVPLSLPVAWWWLDGTPMAWLLGIVPTAWPARALWATSTPGALACLAATVVTAGVIVTLGVRRIVDRVAAPT